MFFQHSGNHSYTQSMVLGVVVLLVSAVGCAQLRPLRFDPTGNCLFARNDESSATSSSSPSPFSFSSTTAAPVDTTATTTATAPPTASPFPLTLFPPSGSNTNNTGTTVASTATDSQNLPLSSSANTATGAGLPGFSPIVPGTGSTANSQFTTATAGAGVDLSPNSLTKFVPASSFGSQTEFGVVPNGMVAVATGPINGPVLLLTPDVQIAPLGSEVIIVASYLGNDSYLRAYQRVEWSLDGVGGLVDYNQSDWFNFVHGQFQGAFKRTERYGETITGKFYHTLDRGTADPKDDITTLPGQTWVSVRSAKEGTSYLTGTSANIKNWKNRTSTAKIHWVDVQWQMPHPSLSPAGESRTLTTTVQRRSNGAPRQHWFVQYEILSGPRAGFGTNLAQMVEVETNSLGQASTDLALSQLQAGTNTIAVRIFQPATGDEGEGNQKLLVGQEVIRQAWTSTGMLAIKMSQIDPPAGTALQRGQLVRYQWTVTNTSASASPATVTMTVPPQLRYSTAENASLPETAKPEVVGSQLVWRLANVPPNAPINQIVTLRAEQSAVADVRVVVTPGITGVTIQPQPTPTQQPSQPSLPSSLPSGQPPKTGTEATGFGPGSTTGTPAPRPSTGTGTGQPTRPPNMNLPSNNTGTGSNIGSTSTGGNGGVVTTTPPAPTQVTPLQLTIDTKTPIRLYDKARVNVRAKNVSGRTLYGVVLAIPKPSRTAIGEALVFTGLGSPDSEEMQDGSVTKTFATVPPGMDIWLSAEYEAKMTASGIRIGVTARDGTTQLAAPQEITVSIQP